MKAATASRPAMAPSPLSKALTASNAAARLHRAASTTKCAPSELSADDGHSLDLLRTLDAMRARGYTVSQPERPQAQLVRGMVTYLVAIGIPSGAKVKLRLDLPQEAA